MDRNDFDYLKLSRFISDPDSIQSVDDLSLSEQDAIARAIRIMQHLAALHGETWSDKFVIALCQQGRRDSLIVKPARVEPKRDDRVELWLNGLKLGYCSSSLENPHNRTVHKVYPAETWNELWMLYGLGEPNEVPAEVANALYSIGGTKQPLDFVLNAKFNDLAVLRMRPDMVALGNVRKDNILLV